MPRPPRRFRSAGAAAAALLALLVGLSLAHPASSKPASAKPASAKPESVRTAHAAQGKPDIILIVTDDQRAESLATMPKVQRLLVRKGVNFVNGMVPTALCCPSRATILTGAYSHDTGVYGNGRAGGPTHGGWRTFYRRGDERRTFVLALDRAGYRTGLFGKYLNGFGPQAPRGYRPPGWDEFGVFHKAAYYNYRFVDDRRWHGAQVQDYSTDVLARRVTDFLKATPQGTPAFAMYTPYGPHRPYVSAARFARTAVTPPVIRAQRPSAGSLWPGGRELAARPPLVQDAPRWVSQRRATWGHELPFVAEAQTRGLLAVDDAVESIVATQRARHRLHQTLFVFMSDNGLLWGEHGMVGKDMPYDAATRVPLVIRWDGRVRPGTVDDRLALNVDIAATLTAAAGVPFRSDGQSLLGTARRGGFVLEAADGIKERPAYCGWRSQDWMYVRYATGREELYDYRSDPGELHNLAKVSAAAGQKARMRAAAKRACRPIPPKFRW